MTLRKFLQEAAKRSGNKHTRAALELVGMIAKAGVQVAEVVSLGQIAGSMGAATGGANFDGDAQKRLDLVANELFIQGLSRAPLAAILSEELPHPLALDASAPLAVAIDPLDGSSNIDANVSIGTIFAIFPAVENAADPAQHFLRPGREQIAAGFIIYGPQTSLVFTMGDGVQVFTLDRRAGEFRLAIAKLVVPHDSTEYAVNAANYRHWDDSIRAYVDDCIRGADGPLGQDHNMRWIASLVADAYRILVRGGVFLYPGDQRRTHGRGRLRCIYEANPIAFLIEQAGGSATDTVQRILDVKPRELHARTPIVFGSRAAVERISQYHTDPQFSAERAPLFFQRGLMRR
ncbi:MAG: class 1 fructose-bisphosphatase [Candidatus Acidiferrales bacterium]